MENLVNILTLFGLDSNYSKIIIINSGHINLTLRIVYSSGKSYILQKINTNVFINPCQVMSNIGKICRLIPGCKLKFLYTGGKNYLKYGSEFWRMYEYIDHSVSLEQPESEDMIYEFGKILGEFHKCTENIDPSSFYKTIHNFHNISGRINKLLPYISDNKESNEFFRKILNFAHRLEKRNLPLKITHNDVKCSNALFDKTTRRCITLIDFDTVMPGLYVHDFGDGARSLCITENKIDLKKFKAYCKGYFQNIDNTNPDDYFLGMICITGELACRYLYDCLSEENYFTGKSQAQKISRYRELSEAALSMIEAEDSIKDAVKNAKREY